MLIPNHPDEERLSALASHDADAAADRSLTDHVASCARCTDLVTELTALRASLADLPDLAPSRPLQLVPGVTAEPDRAAGWARRLFGPLVTAGAALAFVGLVGTALPLLNGMAASGGAAPLSNGGAETAPSAAEPAAGGAAASSPDVLATDRSAAAPSGEALQGYSDQLTAVPEASAEPQAAATDDDTSDVAVEDGQQRTTLTADLERSIWPMLLFAGIAIVIGALLMRWILAPRPG